MKKAIILLLILVLGVFLLAGCSDDAVVLSGKYYFVSMTDSDVVTAEDIEALGVDPTEIYLEFQTNGQFKLEISAIGGESQIGTYVIDKETITLTVDGEPATGTIEGNTITLSADGMTMTFEKK